MYDTVYTFDKHDKIKITIMKKITKKFIFRF